MKREPQKLAKGALVKTVKKPAKMVKNFGAGASTAPAQPTMPGLKKGGMTKKK